MSESQCARDSDGNLKDASEIEFYESESDDKPMPAVSNEGPTRRISTRKRHTDKLTESLAAEHADDDGNPEVTRASRALRAGGTRAPRAKFVPETQSEEEDDDFDMPALEDPSDSDASDTEGEPMDNEEIADLLSSKTVPAHGGRSSKPQTRHKTSATKRKQTEDSASARPAKKATRVTIEEVDDEDDPPKATFKNPIYLFYDMVPKNSEGSVGKTGDKHYKCRHGNGRIITVTKAMRYNVGGLTTHLKKEFPVMYRLYCALYTRREEPPTQQEIELARGDVPIDSEAAKAYLGKVETATANILKSLEVQAKKARGDFSQEVFNTLLAEYIVACDQPFDTVEKPEFIRLMESLDARQCTLVS
ncbi:hypothetical protein B0H10DRAFT_2194010 [Mycena sp. CBHHK59/15]|nr:hypothetical protein B0H10DRAFT_2194010 [Mycena sp. CBHHK59/15]